MEHGFDLGLLLLALATPAVYFMVWVLWNMHRDGRKGRSQGLRD
jgi:hypothetical protein